MLEKENINLFRNLSRSEKLKTISWILENYKYSKNVFNDLYKAFLKNKENLDDKFLVNIYEKIMIVFENFEQKKFKKSLEEIKNIKNNESKDKYLEEQELNKILEEI